MTSRVLFRVNRLLEQAAAIAPGPGTRYLHINRKPRADRARQSRRVDRATGRPRTAPRCPALSTKFSRSGIVDRRCRRDRDRHRSRIVHRSAHRAQLREGNRDGVGMRTGRGARFRRDGISSARAQQYRARDRLICVIVDARKGEVYAALYRVVADGLEKLSDELVVALEHLASRITEDVMFVGDDRAKDAAALVESRGMGWRFSIQGGSICAESASRRLAGRGLPVVKRIERLRWSRCTSGRRRLRSSPLRKIRRA